MAPKTTLFNYDEEDWSSLPTPARSKRSPLTDTIHQQLARLSLSDDTARDLQSAGGSFPQFTLSAPPAGNTTLASFEGRLRQLSFPKTVATTDQPSTKTPMPKLPVRPGTVDHEEMRRKRLERFMQAATPPDDLLSKQATVMLTKTALRGTAAAVHFALETAATLPIVEPVCQFVGFVVNEVKKANPELVQAHRENVQKAVQHLERTEHIPSRVTRQAAEDMSSIALLSPAPIGVSFVSNLVKKVARLAYHKPPVLLLPAPPPRLFLPPSPLEAFPSRLTLYKDLDAFVANTAKKCNFGDTRIIPIQSKDGRKVIQVIGDRGTFYVKAQPVADTSFELDGYKMLRDIPNLENEVRLSSILDLAKHRTKLDTEMQVMSLSTVEGTVVNHLISQAAVNFKVAEQVSEAAYKIGRGLGFMHHARLTENHFITEAQMQIYVHMAKAEMCELPLQFRLREDIQEGILEGYRQEAASLVHHDLHPSNLIHKKGDPIGIIDPARIAIYTHNGKPNGSSTIDRWITQRGIEFVGNVYEAPKEMIQDWQQAFMEGYRATNPIRSSESNELFARYYSKLMYKQEGWFDIDPRKIERYANEFKEEFE